MTSDILRLVELGWRVVPCKPRSKEGLISWTLALTDPAAVDAWLKVKPTHNWGVVLGPESGIICVDVENTHGHGEFERLQHEHGHLPACPRVITGSMTGEHYYLRWPKGDTIKRNGDTQEGATVLRNHVRLGSKVELRGAKHLMMVPPSRHPLTGWAYQWVPGYEPWNMEPPDAPAWLVERMIQPPPLPRKPRSQLEEVDRYVRRAVELELEQLGQAPNGDRNHSLNKSAFALLRFVAEGFAESDTIVEGLLDEAQHIGLSADEALKTIKSAARARGVRL